MIDREALRGQIVAIMQTAESRYGNDLCSCRRAGRRCPACRSLLIQAEMRPIVVVIANEFGHEPLQMAFIQHDDMIEQVTAATADETPGHAVLPGAFERGADRLHADSLCCLTDLGAEGGVPVEDQIARRGVVRKSFAELLRHPVARRMFG